MARVSTNELTVADFPERERPIRRSFAKGFLFGLAASIPLWGLITWAAVSLI
jgi:hypothetical protein